MPRVLPIAAAVATLVAWAGVAFLAMSPSGEKAGKEEVNAGEMKAGLRDLKGQVLGKNTNVRGDKVVGNVVKPREQDFNYTPREVCLKMKLDYPEQYANLDCSKPEYDSPHSWNDWGD